MAEPQWFNDGALTVSDPDDSDASIDIAGLRGVTITPGYETEAMRTADSTFRETIKQYEHAVTVEIDYAFFDIEAAQIWLGGEGTTATDAVTESADTSDPKRFGVERVDPSTDGSVERTTAVENVVFPEFPLVDGSQDEYEEYGLSGMGDQITELDDTSA